MRVRTIELRALAAAILAGWLVTAALLMAGYRPGGPFDLGVALAALGPAAIAAIGVAWPPVARGRGAFAAIAWLGIGTVLLQVPSIANLVGQLSAGGPQTLLPSPEAAYPWALALLATSVFSGLGLARVWLGDTALRRRRLIGGLVIGALVAALAGGLFASVAIANELALRDRPIVGSRFGPTDPAQDPPACDAAVGAGRFAQLELTIEGDVDGRPIGEVVIRGIRAADDFRWAGFVAGDRQVGQFGSARIGEAGWRRSIAGPWRRVDAVEVAGDAIDRQIAAVALAAENRPAPEDRGVAVIEGARARHCRMAIDGPTFRAAFPQAARISGESDMARWRGELDYWIFLDGQLGRVDVAIAGDALGIGVEGLQGHLTASMQATNRDRPVTIVPPTR